MKKKRLKGEPFDWQDLLYQNGDPDFPDLSQDERDMVNQFKASRSKIKGIWPKPRIIMISSLPKSSAINGGNPFYHFSNWPSTHFHPMEEAFGGMPKDSVIKAFKEIKQGLSDAMKKNTGLPMIFGTIGRQTEKTEAFRNQMETYNALLKNKSEEDAKGNKEV